MKNFLSTGDLSRAEFDALIDAAIRFKAGSDASKPLAGSSVALVFFDPSLRTRASMQVGIYELGGNAVTLEPGGTSWSLEHRENVVMDGDKTEHISDFVRVLSRYVSAIGVRAFAGLRDWSIDREDPILAAFTRYSSVPVINLESAMHHPCQALADMMTIREHRGSAPSRVVLTWAWHPKMLPMAVPNSFALAAAQCGHELVIANPKGYELDDELMSEVRAASAANGGSISITNDPSSAFDGADIIYAKSWGSREFYGRPEEETRFKAALRHDWIVTEEKMARTNSAAFMHCLPVRRNVIVTDAVIDALGSLVIDEAENRLHVQKAVLAKLAQNI